MFTRVKVRDNRSVPEVIDSDTGERLKGLQKVVITHEHGIRPEVELSILSNEPAKYDAEADAVFEVMATTTGEMKRVKKIEFEDGEIIEYGATGA